MSPSLRQISTFGLLATATIVKALPGMPAYIGPDDPNKPDWVDGHLQPDAELKGEDQTETFHGVHEDSSVPQKKPFNYKTQGIDWYNFAKVDSDKVLGKDIIDFPQGHRRTQVAAVAGVADKQGHALSNAVAMMTLQPHSDVCRFDLHSFDFFCLDRTHRPVKCSMGISTSKNQAIGKEKEVGHEEFRFEPRAVFRTQMSRAYVKPDIGTGLVLASMGIELAKVIDTMDYENKSEEAVAEHWSDLRQVTLYVDNIEWTSHKCIEGTWAVITHHFAQWLNMVQNPAAFNSSAVDQGAEDIKDEVYTESDSDEEEERRKADKKQQDEESREREDQEMLKHKVAYHKHPVLKWFINKAHKLGEKMLHKGQDKSLDALDKASH